MTEIFHKIAQRSSSFVGSSYSFVGAALVILVWAITGPIYHFSDTWQLVINTGTTTVTFLLVFLIQNTQNRDNAAGQLKLDEIIRSIKGARNTLIDLEDMSDEDLKRLQEEFARLQRKETRFPKGNRDKTEDTEE